MLSPPAPVLVDTDDCKQAKSQRSCKYLIALTKMVLMIYGITFTISFFFVCSILKTECTFSAKCVLPNARCHFTVVSNAFY